MCIRVFCKPDNRWGGGTGHPIKLVATDYDTYIIENAKRVLEHDNFLIEKFDFYTDDVTEIANRHSSDMAVMFGSSCSLNDEKYISFLKDLKKTNVKYVLTFEAGVSDNYIYFKRCMITLLSAVKTYLTKNEKKKKVAIHAFARSDRKLLKIFKTADIKYHEIKSDIYRKVYVLEL